MENNNDENGRYSTSSYGGSEEEEEEGRGESSSSSGGGASDCGDVGEMSQQHPPQQQPPPILSISFSSQQQQQEETTIIEDGVCHRRRGLVESLQDDDDKEDGDDDGSSQEFLMHVVESRATNNNNDEDNNNNNIDRKNDDKDHVANNDYEKTATTPSTTITPVLKERAQLPQQPLSHHPAVLQAVGRGGQCSIIDHHQVVVGVMVASHPGAYAFSVMGSSRTLSEEEQEEVAEVEDINPSRITTSMENPRRPDTGMINSSDPTAGGDNTPHQVTTTTTTTTYEQTTILSATLVEEEEEIERDEEKIRESIREEILSELHKRSVEANVEQVVPSSSRRPPGTIHVPPVILQEEEEEDQPGRKMTSLSSVEQQQSDDDDIMPKRWLGSHYYCCPRSSKGWQLLMITIAFFAVLALAVVVVAVVEVTTVEFDTTTTTTATTTKSPQANSSSSSNNSSGTQDLFDDPNQSTIDRIQERGYVICGSMSHLQLPGLHYPSSPRGDDVDDDDDDAAANSTTTLEGLYVDLCRAISLAIFKGDPNRYKRVPATWTTNVPALNNRSIDVWVDLYTHTMGRDAAAAGVIGGGVSFSIPVLYGGLTFGGVPQFVDCAERLETFMGECRDMKICAVQGTTMEALAKELLPGAVLVVVKKSNNLLLEFASGACNVVAAHPVGLTPVRFQDVGYQGEFVTGERVFDYAPYALATREAEPEWTSFINVIVNTLFLAEAQNIGKDNADDIRQLMGEDTDMADRMVSLLHGLGNYGDIYRRHMAQYLPRQGLNSLYTANTTTGLLAAFPFGSIDVAGPDLSPESTLGRILTRGYLRCGLGRIEEGFGFKDEDEDWIGLDVEYCKALAAAAFAGDTEDTVVFFDVSSSPHIALARDEVDVVSGARIHLQANLKEPTSGLGFTFSSPYFYITGSDTSRLDAYGLMTREDDTPFSEFVYWTAMALVYAEEQGIDQDNSFLMPIVGLFGESLKQMFRDAVLAVGNHGQIYNNTLQASRPRSLANRLNEGWAGSQQFPYPYL